MSLAGDVQTKLTQYKRFIEKGFLGMKSLSQHKIIMEFESDLNHIIVKIQRLIVHDILKSKILLNLIFKI